MNSMSFDDYANHIYQKHRLALALAILKSKPTNVKTDDFLKELKSRIDHKMDEDEITVCSDDFLMEGDDDEMNDSVTILKDFDPNLVINEDKSLGADNNPTSKKPSTETEIINRNIPENLSQITHYDGSQTQYNSNIEPLTTSILLSQNDKNFNQILDIEASIPKNVIRDEFNDRMRNVDQNTDTLPNSDVTYYDSQKTLLYTVHGFTQNNTHYSPSQPDIIIPNKYLYNVNKTNDSIVQNKDISKEYNTETANMQNVDNKTKIDIKRNSLNNEKPMNKAEFEYIQTMNMFSQTNDEHFDEIQNNIHLFDNERHETENSANQNLTQYSQNVDEYFENNDMTTSFPPDNKTKNADHDPKIKHNTEINDITIGYRQNIDYLPQNKKFIQNNTMKADHVSKTTDDMEINDVPFGYSHNIDYLSQNKEFSQNNTKKADHDLKITDDTEMNDVPFGYSQNNDYLSQTRELSHSQNEFDKVTKVKYTNQFQNDNTNADNMIQNSEKHNQLATIACVNDSSNKHRREEEEELESEEIISYKVLEEFNKVKSFLKRQNGRMSCDGYSTDSGYRSDSQRSNNRSVLQLSGNWLNQSGCCLFNYVMQCHLVASTRDITNEIAQVLSQLIDRLHEEEKYPSFLEDLLETIDFLLRQVYEGKSSEDGEFLKKDENIQRILLLNKSIHIQKHTLEKITNILETFHKKVTETESTFELSNIDQIENVTYIFHILEILLKKYLKNREELSQVSTQNSQDDEKLFKKSSISDIWRKKWNPSQTVFEGSREKKCVLKNCSEILNKIVVDCVSSYSLIAYSALKCFNSMQT